MAYNTPSESCRSAWGEITSLSSSRRTKSRVSSRIVGTSSARMTLVPESGDVGDVVRGAFGIERAHQLGDNDFERRAALDHRAQLWNRALCDDPAAMQHDHLAAQPFDAIEQVRAVDDKLAAGREDRDQMTQHEPGREVQAGFRLIE